MPITIYARMKFYGISRTGDGKSKGLCCSKLFDHPSYFEYTYLHPVVLMMLVSHIEVLEST